MRIPAVLVIGGGESGACTVRQLLGAVGAGRLSTARLLASRVGRKGWLR